MPRLHGVGRPPVPAETTDRHEREIAPGINEVTTVWRRDGEVVGVLTQILSYPWYIRLMIRAARRWRGRRLPRAVVVAGGEAP